MVALLLAAAMMMALPLLPPAAAVPLLGGASGSAPALTQGTVVAVAPTAPPQELWAATQLAGFLGATLIIAALWSSVQYKRRVESGSQTHA